MFGNHSANEMKVSSLQLEWNSVNADSLLLYHLIPPAILRSVYQAGKEYTGGGGEPSTLRCAIKSSMRSWDATSSADITVKESASNVIGIF